MDRNITFNISYTVMSDEQWSKLEKVYTSLPGWMGFGSDGCPTWFGREGKDPEFLWGSVEPSGLQITGTLNDQKWLDWRAQFERKARETLGFMVHDADE
jgi:hypothetical protein